MRQFASIRHKMILLIQVFHVVQSAQLWQSFPNDCQTFIKRLGHSAQHAQLAKHATTCHIINHHKSSHINITQRSTSWQIRAILNNFKTKVRFCQMNHFYKIDSARGTIFSKSLQVVPTCKPCQTVSHLRQFARRSQTFNQNCAICARDEKWISLCQLIHFGTPY